jgi:hypothetical protein
MPINLSIFTGDITVVLGSFNVLRVERSISGVVGPFVEITAPTATPASLTAPNGGSLAVSGLTLQIQISNEPPALVTFTGTNPLTPAQIVSQINAVFSPDIATEVTNHLKLTSPTTGTDSKVKILGGTSLSLFGFTVNQTDIGEDPYIALTSGQETYSYTDDAGEAGYFYRTWFFHTTTLLESPRSDPFEGVPGTQVTSGQLSLATIDLVDLSGKALPNRKISVYPVSQPLLVEGFGVDLGRAGITIETDNSGHAETQLVRGSIVKVVFDGTSFIRTISVPDVSTFDLLEALSAVPDQFSTAVIPNLPAAPRRTM